MEAKSLEIAFRVMMESFRISLQGRNYNTTYLQAVERKQQYKVGSLLGRAYVNAIHVWVGSLGGRQRSHVRHTTCIPRNSYKYLRFDIFRFSIHIKIIYLHTIIKTSTS